MSIFLSPKECASVHAVRGLEPFVGFYWGLINRVQQRTASPGLTDATATSDWWLYTAENLTDAAIVFAIKPSSILAAWLRDAALSVVRRPIDDWIGSPYCRPGTAAPIANLETAHLSWSLAIVYDLARDVFTEEEQEELRHALQEKGLALCRKWLEACKSPSSAFCVMLAGVAVPAAVLADEATMATSAELYRKCLTLFQADGSFGESLQYSNYALSGLMLTREALTRRNAAYADELPLEPYVFKPRWDAASLLYCKPLSGLSAYPIPRSVNFGDSAAIYRASADNLLYLAVRARHSHPEMAGLARWLFDALYLPCNEALPTDRSSFGLINHYGFMTVVLLPQAAQALSPEEIGMAPLQTFECGNVIARNSLEGRTILATRTGGVPLNSVCHTHGDFNSFILTHNRERIFADPGQACFRNLTHKLETASLTHNTCTFDASNHTAESNGYPTSLEQHIAERRTMETLGELGNPVDLGARLLLSERKGDVTIIASEAGMRYAKPLESFLRVWLLCGEHVLFVVDFIRASQPVRTTWSWLLNNRDGALSLKTVPQDRLVARRGNAGMKLFHIGHGRLLEPVYSFIHDASHPKPGQPTEGVPGSGILVCLSETSASKTSVATHAICLDSPGRIAGWHLKQEAGYTAVIEDPSHELIWKLSVSGDTRQIDLLEIHTGRSTTATFTDDKGSCIQSEQVRHF